MICLLELKALEIEDRDVFLRYLRNYNFHTYEYSFLTLYLWKDYCNVQYGIFKEALIIKKNDQEKGSYFMQPIGYTDATLRDIIDELVRLQQEDSSFRCLFADVEESFLKKLKEIYGKKVHYFEDTNSFDYIFETQKMITLTGGKLSKRKNQYQQFINAYSYSIKDIHDESVIKDCLTLSKGWVDSQKEKHREMLFELKGITDVLSHLELLDVDGMAVYVNNEIAGFTIGEKPNDRMAIIHVEKGDLKYKGIYAFINRVFAEKYLSDTSYINREEDLGISRLKKAKRAYDPLKLERKYVVNLCEVLYELYFKGLSSDSQRAENHISIK